MGRFYLSPWVGTGTTADVFRPPVNGAFNVVDLRPDATDAAGLGFLWVPDPIPGAAGLGLVDLGDDPHGGLSLAVRNQLEGRLGLTLDRSDDLGEVLAELLTLHARTDGSRWSPLRFNHRRIPDPDDDTLTVRHRGIYLGPPGAYIWEQCVRDGPGTSITEDFNKADNGLGPDLTWTDVNGTFVVASNRAQASSGSGDHSARADSDLATDDHYAQAEDWNSGIATNQPGVAVRFNSSADTYYRLSNKHDGSSVALDKVVAGSKSALTSATGEAGGSGQVMRLEVDGSDLTGIYDGTTYLTNTDTSIIDNLRTGIAGQHNGVDRNRWDNFAAADLAVAPPTFVAHGTPVSGTGDVTPTWPSHSTNTIGLLFVNSAGNDPVPATPTGFTLIRTEATTGGGTDRARATVFWKRATSGSESAPTVADTGNHQLAYIDTYDGAATSGNVIGAIDGGTKGANSTSFSVPGAVDTTAVDNLVFAVVSSGDNVTHSAWANPNLDDVQERADELTTEGNDGAIAYATGVRATPGTVGSTTGTISASEENGLITFSLSPTTLADPPSDFEQTVAKAYTDGHGTDGVLITGGAAPTLETDVTYAVRVVIERSNSTGTYTGQLEAQKNAGSFFDVTASSTIVRATNSAAITDDENTTERLTSAKTFVAGKVDDRNGANTAIVLTSVQNTELLFLFQLRSADLIGTDSVTLRVRNTHADGDADFTEVLTIDVDIPTRTLPGVVHNKFTGVSAETWGFFGPIMDSDGNIYYVTEVGVVISATIPDPVIRKSADGGHLWQLVDQDTIEDQNGAGLRDVESLYIARNHLGPDVVGRYHLAVQHNTQGNVDIVPFHTGDHATTPDTWRDADTEELPGATLADEDYIHLLEKSTGDRVAIYGQLVSTQDRVAYDYEVSGAWQGETLLDNGTASTNYTHAVASLGLSDRFLVAWFDATNNDIHARAIAAGTLHDITLDLAGAQTVKNFSGTDPEMVAGPLVGSLLFDSTDDKHLVIWLDNSDKLWSVVMTWNSGTSKYDAGTPEQVSTRSVESDFPTGADTTGVSASMAVDYDTGDVFCMFIDAANRDVYRAKWDATGGWETEVKEYTASGDTDRAMYVMCNVFTHSSGNGGAKVLGFVITKCDITVSESAYVDGEAIYDEFELPSGTTVNAGLATETDTALAVTVLKVYPVLLATETDTAFAAETIETKPVLLATETDTALAASILRELQPGRADETDTALGVSITKVVTAALATETDTALAAVTVETHPVLLATETDTALAVVVLKTLTVGLATETDTALATAVHLDAGLLLHYASMIG